MLSVSPQPSKRLFKQGRWKLAEDRHLRHALHPFSSRSNAGPLLLRHGGGEFVMAVGRGASSVMALAEMTTLLMAIMHTGDYAGIARDRYTLVDQRE